jgi:hypothetical protein
VAADLKYNLLKGLYSTVFVDKNMLHFARPIFEYFSTHVEGTISQPKFNTSVFFIKLDAARLVRSQFQALGAHTSPLPFEENRSHTHPHERESEKGARKKQRARVQFLFLTKEGLFPIMTLSSPAPPPLLLAEDPTTHSRRRVDFSEIQFLAISLAGPGAK